MDSKADSALRSATTAGLITLAIGVALVLAPSRMARALRVGEHGEALRAIGAADLALVPGLLAGRHRWRWMAARAGLNLVIAAYWLTVARRENSVGAKLAVGAMVVATVVDGRTIFVLRSARSPG